MTPTLETPHGANKTDAPHSAAKHSAAKHSAAKHSAAKHSAAKHSAAKPGLMPRNRNPKSISIVVPCFNEEEVLPELRRRLTSVFEGLGIPYEIILVDDGSRDRTWEMLCEYQAADPNLKVDRLSRNHGHQLALTCGLDQAAGETVLIMDADLQDPPELVNEIQTPR